MNESMMKADRRGRLRYAPEQKEMMVATYLVSGLSVPRFAKLHGVNYQTSVYWIKKGNRAGSHNHKDSLDKFRRRCTMPGQVGRWGVCRPSR